MRTIVDRERRRRKNAERQAQVHDDLSRGYLLAQEQAEGEVKQLRRELRETREELNQSVARADVLETQLELMSSYVTKWQMTMERDAAIAAAKTERAKNPLLLDRDDAEE